MPVGPPICALRASARRTSAKGFIGWPTPMAGTPAQKGYNEAGNTDSSRKTVAVLKGWPTPDTMTGPHGARGVSSKAHHQSANDLQAVAIQLKGWPTPDTNKRGGPQLPDKRKAGGHSVTLQDAVHALNGTVQQPSSNAATASGASQFNPRFSLWLMGIKAECDACAPTEMRFPQSSRQSSSKLPCPAAPERFDDGCSSWVRIC